MPMVPREHSLAAGIDDWVKALATLMLRDVGNADRHLHDTERRGLSSQGANIQSSRQEEKRRAWSTTPSPSGAHDHIRLRDRRNPQRVHCRASRGNTS